mgnify:CR=1 FL=1
MRTITVALTVALLALTSPPPAAGEVEDTDDDEGDDVLSDMGLGGDDEDEVRHVSITSKLPCIMNPRFLESSPLV